MLMFKVQANKTKKIEKMLTKYQTLRRAMAGFTLLIAVFATVGMSIAPNAVRADSIGDQITQLQQENANNRNAVAQLQQEATSFQDAIARLQSQIGLVQGQIDENTRQQTELQKKIDANQLELVRQKAVLGENIRVSYVDGQITTIEMLATSKNLSDFVDKEEYQTVVKNKIQSALVRISQLQNELSAQKVRVEALLNEQQAQRQQLASSRSEQARMLSYNQSQQGEYNSKTKANKAKIDALIAQQRRANESPAPGGYYFLRFPGGASDINGENYKYANAGFSMSTAPGCVDNDGPDEWGYCTRQCVSYAAWAVEASGRRAPRYYGNAKDWVSAARRDGIPIYSTPQPGDVAISTSGTWGHAMYVEAVSGDSIWVSQYNQQLNGRYSTQWRVYK